MKRAILIIIPSLVFGILVFLALQYFFGTPEKGALQVTATPQSKVYVNGKYIGQTPLCRCDSDKMLAIGDYTLQLTPISGDYLPTEDKISITKSVLTVVDKTFAKGASSEGSIISLSPLPNANDQQLVIVSFPDRASVFLDSNDIGLTPLLEKNVTVSDHVITLRKTGYKEKSVRIHSPAGYKLLATITMAVSDDAIPQPSPQASSTAQLTPSPTPATTKIQILQTPNGFLRVRSDSSLTADEIGRVTTGETYVVQAERDGWYEIKLASGTLGWISSLYASKLPEGQ